MTTRSTATDGPERGPGMGVQDPSLARAHVSVGVGVSRENVPGGKGLGGEERVRVEYLWPVITALEEKELCLAYEALTGRRVWPKMLPLLRVAHRRHGPDTVALLRELYREGGVQDLLVRVRDYPPGLDQRTDCPASTFTSMEADRQGPAGPPPSEPYGITEDRDADQRTPSAPSGTPARQEPTPDGPAARSAPMAQGMADEITTDFPGMPLPGSTPRGAGGNRAASEADPGRRPTLGPDPSLAEPAPARRSRPPDCPYPRHEPTWLPRPDGTMRCATCHP